MLAKSQSTANCGNGRFVLDHAMFDFGQLTIYDFFFFGTRSKLLHYPSPVKTVF